MPTGGNQTGCGGDHSVMRCEECRDAISARLDGEELPGDAAADAHLETCPACRAYAERAAYVTRLTRTRPVEDVPDLTAAVAAAIPRAPVRGRPRRSAEPLVRGALAAVGIGQLALVVAGLVASGSTHAGGHEIAGATATHLAHETVAWDLGLGVGFLAIALGTARVGGLIPVLAAFVAALVGLSAVDLASGRVDISRLATHTLVVAGLILLLVLRRMQRGDGSGATGDLDMPALAGPRPADPAAPTGGGDHLRPTAHHRAA